MGALTTNKETQYLPWQDTLYIGDGVYIYSATKWKPRISEHINLIISNRVTIYLVYHIMVSPNTTVRKIHKLMKLFF